MYSGWVHSITFSPFGLFCNIRCKPGFWLCERLGGKEGATAPDACTEPQGLRLEEVEEAVAVSAPGRVQQLPGTTATAESTPSTIGRITLGMKRAGKRSAGKPHAAFDVAGAGNVATVAL